MESSLLTVSHVLLSYSAGDCEDCALPSIKYLKYWNSQICRQILKWTLSLLRQIQKWATAFNFLEKSLTQSHIQSIMKFTALGKTNELAKPRHFLERCNQLAYYEKNATVIPEEMQHMRQNSPWSRAEWLCGNNRQEMQKMWQLILANYTVLDRFS